MRFPRLELLVPLCLLPALAACGGAPERPNVVLVSIDSLRADRLGIYGHDRPASPVIDRLAEEGVVFDAAWSTTSWTLPSHLSLLTGLYPEVHGVVGGRQALAGEAVLVSELLGAAGYRTAAVVSGPYLGRRFGFDQGWDLYDDFTISFSSDQASHTGVVTPRQHERIVEVLDAVGDGPFLLFLHYWDVHLDYTPPPPYDTLFDPAYDGEISGRAFLDDPRIHPAMESRDLEHLLALYDGEVAHTDRYLGELFAELERRGLWRNALVVVTADHGDEFFEHGGKGHRRSLYDETLRVPLVVRLPGGRHGGARVSEPVSLVDLAPTILEAAGLEPAAGIDGRSLLPLARGETGPDRRYLFADLHGVLKAVRRGPWKYVAAPAMEDEHAQLYHLGRDPGETENLAGRGLAEEAELRRALDRWLAAAEARADRLGAGAAEIDEATRRALEALGYVD